MGTQELPRASEAIAGQQWSHVDETPTIRKHITFLAERIHAEDYANILTFYIYLSRAFIMQKRKFQIVTRKRIIIFSKILREGNSSMLMRHQ